MNITENDIDEIYLFTIEQIKKIYNEENLNDIKIKEFFENKEEISQKLFEKCKLKINKIDSK